MGSVGRGGQRLGSVTQVHVDVCLLYFFTRSVSRPVGRSVGVLAVDVVHVKQRVIPVCDGGSFDEVFPIHYKFKCFLRARGRGGGG